MKRQNNYDIVYFVKEAPQNEELRYSLRTVEKNWPCRYVWFYGGRPNDLMPDKAVRFTQKGLNKWEKVKNSIIATCENEDITEDFWLFNDDFFILKPRKREYEAEYNGLLEDYIETIKRKNSGSHSQYTLRLLNTIQMLKKNGCSTLNYEVHKPMLINRKKAIEVMYKFPGVPGFRSLYGNYWKVKSEDCYDMKIKDLVGYGLEDWGFLSTSDSSFRDGEVGQYIRDKFNRVSRFEKEAK